MLRRVTSTAAVLTALAVLAGCGVSSKDASQAGGQGPQQDPAATGTTTIDAAARAAALPARPAGVIRVDGVVPGSLPAQLIQSYQGSGTSAEFAVSGGEEGDAFKSFCAGGTDIVSSQAPITPSDYAACQANGVEPVQVEIASDAAILAIANETNVGVDCLSAVDVREIFRAASPVSSWSEVGYGDSGLNEPLKVTGPEPSSGLLSSFSDLVLGDSEPSRLLLRGDYQAHPDETEVLNAVSGETEEEELASHQGEFAKSAKGLKQAVRQAQAAVAAADFQVKKGVEDKRSESEQEADSKTLAAAEEKVVTLAKELEQVEAGAAKDERAAQNVAARLGTLGLFRFGFYELWEERLRPMEIEATNSESKPECIFPSQSTVTDASYPLAHQLLLTVNLKTMKEAEVNQFLAFALSQAQSAASAETLVPLPDEVKNTELAWLHGEVSPDVVYYPQSRIAADERQGAEAGQS